MLDSFNNISSKVKLLKRDKLDDSLVVNGLLPELRNLTYIGAIGLFHNAVEMLSDYDENIDFQICKALDCHEYFNYKGMAYWLNKVRNNTGVNFESKALAAINIIFANANNGCFDNSVEWAIDTLEDAILNHNYSEFEAYENLMQELERKDSERLKRYVDYLKSHKCKTWKDYSKIATVLWNHYKRNDDFVSLKRLLVEVDMMRQQYTLTDVELLEYDLNLLSRYFESRDGRWEQFSIYVFRRHEEFLNNDIHLAFAFARSFLNIVQQGHQVYGRNLNEDAFFTVANAIRNAIDRHIKDSAGYYESLPIEMLNERIFWNEVYLLKAEVDCTLEKTSREELLNRKAKIYKKILNLCELNCNQRDYLHWLLIYTEETAALSESRVNNEELKCLAYKLNDFVKNADYSSSIAYYLIFLSKIWDSLEDDEQARFYLMKFEQTGAFYKMFGLGVQSDYLALVRKYLSNKNDELQNFLNDYEYLCLLNSQRNAEEALIRAKELFSVFPFCDINQVAKFGGENVSLLIHKCAHIFLNANRLDLLDNLWKTFLRFNEDWRVNPDVSAEIRLTYGVGLFRQGKYDEANKLIDELISDEIHDKIKTRAYVLKGQIETAYPGTFNLNSYINALALAEKYGDFKEMAHVYEKIAVFLGKHFSTLSISFLRKAECIYERLGMIDDLYETYLLRVQAYIGISLSFPSRYGSNAQLLFKEAVRLIKEYPRSVFKSESSRAFHDRVSGVLLCDVNRLKESFLFYKRSDAFPDMLITLGTAVCALSMNGRRDEAIKFANDYSAIAKEHNDSCGYAYAAKMIEMLNTPNGIVRFTCPGSPYSEKTLFDILDRIAFEEEIWAIDKSPVRNHFPKYQDEGKCIPFKNDQVVTLNPIGLLPNKYYRGQNHRHPKCLPTLYRIGMTDSKKFVERLKFCEFYLLLETHPILTKFKNTFCYKYPDGHPEVFNFNVYHLGLAQHYGICTELIDITSDKWVAAFFASTKYNEGEYTPFDETGLSVGDRKGVFYIYEESDPENLRIRPIGIQPFSRPGEQSGYAYPLAENEDFEEKAHAIEFVHHKEINEFIFNYTNRSRKLFPEDILETKASLIRNSCNFSQAAYDLAVKRYYDSTTPEQLQEWISTENISITKYPIIEFSVEDMDLFTSQWPTLMESIRERILILNLGHKKADGTRTIYSTRN